MRSETSGTNIDLKPHIIQDENLTSKTTLSHLLSTASYVGSGGTVKGHALGIPREVLHNNGFLTITSKRSDITIEEFELLVEMEELVSRTEGFCENNKTRTTLTTIFSLQYYACSVQRKLKTS